MAPKHLNEHVAYALVVSLAVFFKLNARPFDLLYLYTIGIYMFTAVCILFSIIIFR